MQATRTRVKVSPHQRAAIMASMQELAMIHDTLHQARAHQTTIMELIAEANGFDPEAQQVQFDPVTGEMILAETPPATSATAEQLEPPTPIGTLRPTEAVGED